MNKFFEYMAIAPSDDMVRRDWDKLLEVVCVNDWQIWYNPQFEIMHIKTTRFLNDPNMCFFYDCRGMFWTRRVAEGSIIPSYRTEDIVTSINGRNYEWVSTIEFWDYVKKHRARR